MRDSGAERPTTENAEGHSLDPILVRGTLLYVILASAFLICFGTNPLVLIAGIAQSLSRFHRLIEETSSVWALLLLASILILIPALRRRLWVRKMSVVLAVVYCSVFFFTFGIVKNHLHLAVPFWADGLLLQVDMALHGGNPLNSLGWLGRWSVDTLALFYINSWLVLAAYMPVVLVAFDDNAKRRKLFTLLWMFCWVGLGNILAVAFMSYGPIFADLFPSGEVVAHEVLSERLTSEDARVLNFIRMELWQAYTGESATLGSGISAFPSVHVGMATVLALYFFTVTRDALAGRAINHVISRVLLAAVLSGCVRYVGVYQILSVYLGWHYAVDGYASILLMLAIYAIFCASPVNESAVALPAQSALP